MARRLWFRLARRGSRLAGRAARSGWSRASALGERQASRVLADLPRPTSPIRQPWEISLATLVSRHPKVPRLVGRRLHKLDRYGQVAIAPDRVGFDGKTVRWSRVIEIRACPASVPYPQAVVDTEVERIRRHLPRVPGRRWMLTKVVNRTVPSIMDIARVAGGPPPDRALLPCQIVYRTVLGRPATLHAGLFAAAVMIAIPEAAHSLTATAGQHAIPIRPL
jgi:hypothetical protein